MKNYKQSRGWRNNNPLNIRRGERWIGLASQPRDTQFCTFMSMSFGYRAGAKVLKSYYRVLGQQGKAFTVENIIRRWAPDNENPTSSYVKRVTRLLLGDEYCGYMVPTIELGRPDTPQGARHMAQLMAAMTCVECGCPPSAVPYMAILEGVDMAYGIHPSLDSVTL